MSLVVTGLDQVSTWALPALTTWALPLVLNVPTQETGNSANWGQESSH